MRALITGASGFVSPHLQRHLEECGDEVIALDRSTQPAMDVTDASGVRDAIAVAKPDAIYHLAALSHVGESWDAPQKVFRVNVEGTLNVLRAALDARVHRVLIVGSSESYGKVKPDELPITETTPMRPLSPYGASKAAADLVALQQFLGENIPAIRTRSFSHTGPRQEPRFVVPAFATRILEAKREGTAEIPVGNLDAIRDFSDVRDVVRAYRTLIERGEPGEVYNVCSGNGIAIREVAEELIKLAGAELTLQVDPELVRPIEVPVLIGDATKLHAIGWKPEFSLQDTLKSVLDSLS